MKLMKLIYLLKGEVLANSGLAHTKLASYIRTLILMRS